MAREIKLRWPATCADCGTRLNAGDPAAYYGGRVFGRGCHARVDRPTDSALAGIESMPDRRVAPSAAHDEVVRAVPTLHINLLTTSCSPALAELLNYLVTNRPLLLLGDMESEELTVQGERFRVLWTHNEMDGSYHALVS